MSDTSSPTQSRTSWVAFGVLLTISILLLIKISLPLWKPLFLAGVLASLFKGVNDWLALRFGNRPRVAAFLVTTGVVILLLLPISALATMVVSEAIEAFYFVRGTLEEGGLNALAAKLPDGIEQPLREALVALHVDTAQLTSQLSGQAATGGRLAASALSGALTLITDILFSLAMFLVAFYALLVEGRRLLRWLEVISPLPAGQATELFGRFRQVARSVVGSNAITAAAQAITAGIGYYIAGVPNVVFFSLLTFFASFLPSVGTAIVAYPLVGLLLVLGMTWQAIFLALWAGAVVGLVDNVLKPYLIRGGAELHGVVVFFSLIGGVIVFGAIGLIVGPLVVSFFLTMVRFGRRDFMPHQPAILVDASGQPLDTKDTKETKDIKDIKDIKADDKLIATPADPVSLPVIDTSK